MSQSEKGHRQVSRLQRNALIIAGAGLAIGATSFLLGLERFFQGYLFGYVFAINIAIGCLGILLIHQLAGGQWGFTIRRFLEFGANTIPIMAVLFIPVLIGIPYLYRWADPELVHESHLLEYKAGWWLNIPFFVGRSVLYFIIWGGVGYSLKKLSLEQDRTGDPKINDRLKSLSALGIILTVLASTFAAYDWTMSLDPLWYSSMYGVIFMGGSAVAAIAGAILFTFYMSKRDEALGRQATIYIFNDLGNFLLAFVSFWAYVSFSQYLIIWSANLPETITWYVVRGQNGWQFLAIALIIFGFAVPFLLLLSRRNKRNTRLLVGLSIFVIFMRFVDFYWIIVPEFYPEGFYLAWHAVAFAFGFGGLWLFLLVRQIKDHSLLPLRDSRFPESSEDAAHAVSSTRLQEA